jgi:hypothetical protein
MPHIAYKDYLFWDVNLCYLIGTSVLQEPAAPHGSRNVYKTLELTYNTLCNMERD